MTGASVAELRRRWTPERLGDLQKQISAQSKVPKGPHQFETDWPETEGELLDLRGLSCGRDGVQFRFATIHNADFRYSRGRLSFFECELFDCLFDSATLSGQPRFDRSFVRCSFRAAKLRGLALGKTITDCDFTGADLRKLACTANTRFERCTFDNADLSGADFGDVSFIDCTFSGAELSESTSFTRCAFSNAMVEFGPARVTRSTLDGEVLPDQWDGEEAAAAALVSYARRYAAAAATSDADDLSLEADPGK